MSESPQKFYLTTPIYYVNARPHIGHAYTTIVADVLARRHRLLGDDTFFLTGTDEHGQKIERSASAAGIPPQQFADQVSQQFRDLWDRMGLTYTDYIRTTDPAHKAGVQHLFTQLWEKGFIYLDKYTGSYCVSDEAFVDAPVGTPCPDCGRLLEEVTEENFFFKLSEFQVPLINLIELGELKVEPDSSRNEVLSFLRGNPVGMVLDYLPGVEAMTPKGSIELATKALTIETDDPTVEALLNDGKLGQLNGKWYVPGALKNLSISRSSFTWGIPVPKEILEKEKATQPHVIYVWLDALANYMTALGYPDGPNFRKFWPADLHLVGKEITRFHCVYWPAFLMAAGIPTPKRITANGWLLFDNSKMSKSKGNVVRTETILEGFGEHVYAKQFPDSTKRDRDLFASDVLRYFLLREIPFGQDGSFSFEAMVTRYNADLANGYGNLVSRTLKLVETGLGGSFKAIHNMAFVVGIGDTVADSVEAGRYSWTLGVEGTIGGPDPLWKMSPSLEQAFDFHLKSGNFSQALELIAQAIRQIDGFMSESEPWKIAKDPSDGTKEKLNAVLYAAAEAVRIITALLYPILPHATAAVWRQLGLGDIESAAATGELKSLTWGGLQPGTKLGPLAPIFPRAPKELTDIMSEIENPTHAAEPAATAPTPELSSRPEAASSAAVAERPAGEPAPKPTDLSPEITIDDFVKVELRVAEIKLAERIPKADKLLRLEVDLGPLGQRQILSGIAEHYTPEDLIGRRIIVITNLAPRKMRGLESHGMLLAASEEGGKPFLATVPEGVPTGTRLK